PRRVQRPGRGLRVLDARGQPGTVRREDVVHELCPVCAAKVSVPARPRPGGASPIRGSRVDRVRAYLYVPENLTGARNTAASALRRMACSASAELPPYRSPPR